MKHSITFATLAFLAGCASQPQSASQRGQVTDYQTQGNLAPTASRTCFPLRQANDKLTPGDLYLDMRACIDKQDDADAADLFAMGGVYGRFDSLRVSDQTAHQATQV